MRAGLIGELAKAIFKLMPACALIFATAVYPKDTLSSRRSLEVALENAVMCKVDALNIFNGSEFDGGADDPKQRLESLGVNVINESRHGGEIRYQLPSGIKLFGYEAREALFFSESTTLFFVRLKSGPERMRAINKALRLTSVPKGNPDGYGYFNEFDVRYIRKLNGGEDVPHDTIFSGIGDLGGNEHIVIGCQNLAW
ncbi:hypothetical protein [Burkholderia ubonensis]|uniref:hypothetical protein n=1 Tax=Burkholderia ubonensis TaxID=101571 RepID=UPI000AEB3097|nr:hypothetical protein [Burkholderia ubonensis]